MSAVKSLSKRYALLGIFAMACWQLAWHAWLRPPESFPLAFILILALAPIAPAVILALLNKPSAVFWGGVAALLYFCHSITELWASPDIRLLAMVELGLSLWIIFTGNWDGLQAKIFKRKKN